mgnify:FL=1
MKIAIIPARGGSKRIPKKNIKTFYDRPMIVNSIQAAKDSKLYDHIIVSTDCKSIKEVAEQNGAEVPFIRPAELSDDFTGTGPVVNHAIDWFQQNVAPIDFACCIYPTAPFLLASDLQESFKQLEQNKSKSFCFSVARYAFPVQRALTFDEQDEIKMLFSQEAVTRSQDLKEVFHDAGQFYWGRVSAFLDNTPTFGPASIPFFMPRSRVMDIDDEEDWQEAELMYEVLQKKQGS